MATSTVKTLRARLIADVSQFNKQMTSATKRVDKTANRLRGLGTKLSLGVSAPLIAVGVNAVKTAARFDILERKFSAVFGNTARDARQFSKELSSATGRSAIKVREMLSSTQDLLTGFGVTTQESTALSKSFNQLALDVASFQGVSDEQAIQAFNSALTGETESLKTLGVVIKQSDIDQRLLNEGVKDGIKGATSAQKAQAVLALITAQTGNAQGKAAQFARTLQGRLQGLRSRVTDLTVELGNRLVPVAEKVVSFFERMLKAFDNMDEATKRQIVDFGLYAAAIGPAILGLSVMLKVVSVLIGSVGKLGVQIVKLTAGVIGLGRALFTRLIPFLAPVAIPLLAIGAAIAAVVTAFAVAKRSLRISGIDIASTVKTMAKNAAGFLTKLFGPAIDFVKKGFQFLLDKVKTVVEFVSKIPGVREAIAGLKKFVDGFKDGVVESTKFTADFVAESWKELAEDTGPVFERMTTAFKEQMNGMLQAAGLSKDKINELFGQIRLPSLSGGGVLATAGGGGAAGGRDTPTEETGGFTAFFKNLGKDIDRVQLATDLASGSINSFADGIASAAVAGQDFGKTMVSVFKQVTQSLVQAIIKALIFQSIAGVFSGIGGSGSAAANAGSSATALDPSAFSGFAAHGGTFPSGKFGVVGERGPELISGPAQITPFDKLRGGGTVVNVVVENNATNTEVSVEERDLDGETELRLLVSNTIAEDIAKGGIVSRTIRDSFAGVSPRTSA